MWRPRRFRNARLTDCLDANAPARSRSRELRKRGLIPKVSPAWLDDNPLIRYEFIVVEGEPPRHARLPLGTTARIVRAIAPLADQIELGQPSPDQLAELPDVAIGIPVPLSRIAPGIDPGRASRGESYSLALDQVAFAPWAALLVDDASDPDGDEILPCEPQADQAYGSNAPRTSDYGADPPGGISILPGKNVLLTHCLPTRTGSPQNSNPAVCQHWRCLWATTSPGRLATDQLFCKRLRRLR